MIKDCCGWLFVGALTVCCHAQETKATWQGTYQLDGETHRVVLQATQAGGGQWVADGFYIDFLSAPIHLERSSLSNSGVTLLTNAGKGDLEASFKSNESRIHGIWIWEKRSITLELRRVSSEDAWPVPLQYQYHYKGFTDDRPSPAEPRIPFSPRLAVDYMEQGAIAWTAERQCVACHTNGTYMVVRPLMTPDLGAPQQAIRDFFVSTLREDLKADQAKRPADLEPTQIVYVAAGLAIWDAHVTHHLSPETSQALQLMFKLQRLKGDWVIEDDNNPPLESSPYQLATVAARAVANAPGWLAQQRGTAMQEPIDRLKDYLRNPKQLQGDYDRTDLLWTASEYPGLLEPEQTRDLINMILAHQQFDGGWSIRTFATPEEWGKGNRAAKLRDELEFSFPQSDGHMTGLAIIALRKAGLAADNPYIQRGVAWLLANQRSSGRWWTRSLNRDGWQFISYSGTAYPLLALSLCHALPRQTPLSPSGF
jgi:squalene-hopene/tetraprenyl-beta-curcumene cyclase